MKTATQKPKKAEVLTRSLGLHWPSVIWITLSPFLALGLSVWYISQYGITNGEILLWAFTYFFVGLGITAGYHRYFSHRTHDAHAALEWLYLIMGTMVLQRSALDWSRNHRVHHRFADTEQDPHDIHRGFFHAHMGWIFHHRPLDSDYSAVPDLLQNPRVIFQHKHYWSMFAIFGVGLPIALGWMVGRPLGGFILIGLARLVLQNHVIFAINSVAHTFGIQRYSLSQEARDSWLLAFISNGEGFHSFHHRFASDYRNGWRWFHWDPSKWFIWSMSKLGLVSNLKTAPEKMILQAQLLTDQERALRQLATLSEDRRSHYEKQLLEARAKIESLLQTWQETKVKLRAYRLERKRSAMQFSRDEYESLQAKMETYRREYRQACADWAALVQSLRMAAASR